MGNSISLYGSIGYSYLTNTNINPKFILLLSDNHAKLSYCNDHIMISEWLKNKSNANKILLEEVPRDNMKLNELFGNSLHTQELKKLFLTNTKLIHGVDIRPLLIKFSWELLDLADLPNIKLIEYIEGIESFYNLNNNKIKEICINYNNEFIKNSIHFNIIKKKYINFKTEYYNYLNEFVIKIFNSNKTILEEINCILDDIMEFYIILNIFNKENKNIIIHTGLMHSNKLLVWLTNYYNYIILEEKGVTKIEQMDTMPITNGCLELSKVIDNQLSTINYN